MRGLVAGRISIMIAVGVLAAGCSAAPETTGRAGGGDISKIDACGLLSATDMQQALGMAFGPGKNQDSNIVKQCEWEDQGSSVTVGLTIRSFIDSDWRTVQIFPKAVAVSGMGEAAYRNSPLTGALTVKQHGYQIDMGIVNFSTMSRPQIDKATDDLMRLVLARI